MNAAGGIAIGGTKEKLKLVVLDNGSDPGTASSQARELVLRDHAVALLGFATPLIVTPTALVAEQLRVPFLTSLMPVEAFADGDKTGWNYSWDLFYDEQQQAADAAKALASVPSDKKVALFTDNEPDDVVERPLYTAAFKADGLDVVGDYTFPVGTTDFSSFIADAKAKGAQLLAGQMAPAGGVALWKQLKSSGFRPKAAFLAKASDAGSWWQSLGSLAQGTLSEGYWSPGQASPGQLATIAPTLGKKYAGNPELRRGGSRLRGGRGADRRARQGRRRDPRQAQHRDLADRRADHRRADQVQPVHAHGDHAVLHHPMAERQARPGTAAGPQRHLGRPHGRAGLTATGPR